ncbi:expansin EXLX1 family cellulose-binding protein [Sphaerisporangium sp. TRM90804]|uniref:expansin EXLX1 family cellulose-binding protein n=1 Tax=Sphaerisporangium sp. TRM90804 TaxID=3031113 RepID=UPI00244BD170|nr:expansin EXLX1 family cellulose-binding protein [Sphaerisporangium sp. TRM90804]MDH2424632.1 expansin EXLX1 family cellulose-binding protein [Sphaerisporangium sp. TRM90804]
MNAERRHARQPGLRQRVAWAASMAAALTLLALGAQAGRNAACAGEAAVPDPAGVVAGTCSLTGAVRGDMVTAVSSAEYAGSAACGAYLDVTGPRGTVRVQVIDECPACPPGRLDMSPAAFARIADPGESAVAVSYHTVHNPAVPRPVAFRLKKGSSARWLAIQAVDHGNPLRSLEILDDGRWRALTRDSGNYWVAGRGAGAGPYTVRITDVHGQRLTAGGITLGSERLQRTGRRLYGPTATPVRRHGTPPGQTPSPPGAGTPEGPGAPGDAYGGAGQRAPDRAGPGGETGPHEGTVTAGGTRPGTESGTSLGTGPGEDPQGSAAAARAAGGEAGQAMPEFPERAPLTALPSAPPFLC